MPATPPETPYDVFISYSHRDKAWVKGELLPRLEAAGLKVCLDDRDFRIGAPIVREMERAVLTSRHTIAVLTPAYLSSAWTDFEALMIATLDPGSQQERLLPLLLEPCDVPIRMKYLGYADFAAPDDLALSWRRLLDALAASVDPGTKPDTAWPAENAGPATPPPAPAFNTAAVRELLMAAFSDEELMTFCYRQLPARLRGIRHGDEPDAEGAIARGVLRAPRGDEAVAGTGRAGQSVPV